MVNCLTTILPKSAERREPPAHTRRKKAQLQNTAEGVKKVASDSRKDDSESAEAGTSKSDSKEVKPKKGDKEIQDSESTSSDASDYLPKKKSE